MKRRDLLRAGLGCCACWAGAAAQAQGLWQAPARFLRPDAATDEGGLWALMDREERRLRASPFLVRDPALTQRVQEMACRLAAEHCPDVRVYVVATPLFNASMAPNGMMQLWSGLLLRMENEAQLAAVMGHEIGHYLQRHSLERLRDAKSRSAFGQFLGLFGLAGMVGQIALLASMFAYSREQETEADRIGVMLMHKAGYDTRHAAQVWENLMLETQARRDAGREQRNPLFATHPAPQDRQQHLAQLAQSHPGGESGERSWQQLLAPLRQEWLEQEVKRQQHEESLALLDRLVARFPGEAEYRAARGEIYRLRGGAGDLEAARADHEAAVQLGGEPAETHRALGLIYRARNEPAAARACFERYLARAPQAPDAGLVKAYLAELGS